MSSTLLRGFIISIVFLLFFSPPPIFATTEGQEDGANEVGGPDSFDENASGYFSLPLLDGLEPEITVGLGYTFFDAEGIEQTYTGIPQFDAGISLRAASDIRSFFRIAYCRTSGDPLENVPGFDAPEETTVTNIPLTFGLLFDLSGNKKLRLLMGIGGQLAWQQEETLSTLPGGEFGLVKNSGFNLGALGTFGTEILLGENESIAGLEFGYGGAKGRINGPGSSHYIDLTGFTVRGYYGFKL